MHWDIAFERSWGLEKLSNHSGSDLMGRGVRKIDTTDEYDDTMVLLMIVDVMDDEIHSSR